MQVPLESEDNYCLYFRQLKKDFLSISFQGKGDGGRIERSALHDNWDDAEGYYSKYLNGLLYN